MKCDVLAICAHPDDAELSCAGTLMMEKMQGKTVGIADLTKGELGTRGSAELRAVEAANALAVMGLDFRENLGLRDGFFENNEEDRLAVIKVIRKYKPEIILTNAPHDRHPDHGRAAMLVKEAAWLSGLRKIETPYEGVPQEAWRPAQVFHFVQDRYIAPHFVYDISAVMQQKIHAIRAFASQFDAPPLDSEPQTYISTPAFLESIIERAKMFGKMIGVRYAEGFLTDKVPGLRSFDALIHQVT